MASNKIVLVSSDGESFEMEEAAARKSQVIAYMIEDHCADRAIPLQHVTGKILSLVIEYCNKHADDDDTDSTLSDSEAREEKVVVEAKEDFKTWDEEFMKNKDLETIFSLILAANYLNVKGLLDLTCQTVADHIKDMQPEEIRGILNIEKDFTPEEEEEIRKENAWAFEKDPQP